MMQSTTVTTTTSVYTRAQKSCGECRRRKQKCIPPDTPGTQCSNCVKRWPPVQCVFQPVPRGSKYGLRRDQPGIESILVFPTQRRQQSGSGPRAVGGVMSAINCLNSIAIEDTIRNAELMHIFLEYVCPNMVSLDGKDPPLIFRTIMLPWMLQSPLFPSIAILMASAADTLELGGASQAEPFAIKARVLGMINKAIGADHDRTDILRCVIHLVIIEWFWGDEASMWAHLRGLKDLVTARGGIGSLNDPLFLSVLILTDYVIACCFEKSLCIQDGLPPSLAPPAPATHSSALASPLREYDKSFVALRSLLVLDLVTAKLLDDIRFLTVSITSLLAAGETDDADEVSKRKTKIKNTASFIQTRLKIPEEGGSDDRRAEKRSDDELVAETIALAASVYLESITSLQPLTRSKTSIIQERLYASMSAVSPRRWKRIPGIYLWVVLVAVAQVSRSAEEVTHGDEEDRKRKTLRRRLGTAAQAVGQEAFGLAICYLRAFWVVQRFVVGGKLGGLGGE
ncbi:hypothetical protein QBC47DRAFT_380000 [Echria macrotheca]|uniref:Zn(2)-C6 fungal-type domain-containing protein n=1 Tax=Echria macrotheca TaxID=438768 RepID=A0AAJ0FAM4_9PEZI|nr:hypothetical protein QBC47DRAFT_380000 [Echria macrotheca]